MSARGNAFRPAPGGGLAACARRMRRHCTLLLALLLGLSGGLAICAQQGDAVEVIVNRSVTVASLSKYKLRTVFGMRLTAWPNGDAVRVFVLPDDNPVHRRFAKQQLGVFPHQMRRAWNNLVYSGLGQAPTEVATLQEMLQRVADTPGAIGYTLTGEDNAKLRILPIQ